MKRQNRRFHEAEFVDPDFAEALSESSSDRQSADRKAQRKTQQFCRQVQRALNLTLADLCLEGGDLFVEEVTPAPDCWLLAAISKRSFPAICRRCFGCLSQFEA